MSQLMSLSDAGRRKVQLKGNEHANLHMDGKGDDQTPSKEATLGLVLKILRELSGMPRAELADAIGVGENHLREIEAGRKAATIANIHRIATKLQVSASAIMFFCEDEQLLKSFRPGSKLKPLEFRVALLRMLQHMNDHR